MQNYTIKSSSLFVCELSAIIWHKIIMMHNRVTSRLKWN
uniref:Uncharacterized protein n=1 Tax=virus sp. ctx9V1 TaxID=2828001 RepID=A0A8S5RDJ5_9VIRU|nr:MAG TPA: hypothetical protein [virus sp. ctx9V1]